MSSLAHLNHAQSTSSIVHSRAKSLDIKLILQLTTTGDFLESAMEGRTEWL